MEETNDYSELITMSTLFQEKDNTKREKQANINAQQKIPVQ
jgi:hypothetical protein